MRPPVQSGGFRPNEAKANRLLANSPPAAESSHTHITVDGQCPLPTSPGVPHLRFNRRASEASLASQVSGLADSYTASNIATSKCGSAALRLEPVFSPNDVLTVLFPPSERCLSTQIRSQPR